MSTCPTCLHVFEFANSYYCTTKLHVCGLNCILNFMSMLVQLYVIIQTNNVRGSYQFKNTCNTLFFHLWNPYVFNKHTTMSYSANTREILEYDHLRRNASLTWVLSYEFAGIIGSIMSTIKAQWITPNFTMIEICYC
jgi:hypothetical protein